MSSLTEFSARYRFGNLQLQPYLDGRRHRFVELKKFEESEIDMANHFYLNRPEDVRDKIRISADEYMLLEELTVRNSNNADGIFSVDADSIEIFASTRFGQSPREERLNLADHLQILRSLQQAMSRSRKEVTGRESGGRLFVNRKGAFWKTDTENSKPVEFATWEWKGDEPPVREKPRSEPRTYQQMKERQLQKSNESRGVIRVREFVD